MLTRPKKLIGDPPTKSFYQNEVLPEKKKGGLSPSKAHEMLRDGTAHGKKLTAKQKKYFGYIYGRSKQMGGVSELGYSKNSPYKNNPYLDIQTPTGDITMAETEFPLLGTDNFGNSQMMYPGGEYKFPGTQVRETPLYQRGGRTPIYTTDKNDPRLKRYQDSLGLYNMGRDYYKSVEGSLPKDYFPNSGMDNWTDANHRALLKDNNPTSTIAQKSLGTGIMPIGMYNGASDNYLPTFKRPVQPVVLQDWQAIRGQEPIGTPRNTPSLDMQPPMGGPLNLEQAYDGDWSATSGIGGDSQQTRKFASKQALDSFIQAMKESGNQPISTDYRGTDYGSALFNRFQRGGTYGNRVYNFLFEDDEEDNNDNSIAVSQVTAPSIEELEMAQVPEETEDDMAMNIALSSMSEIPTRKGIAGQYGEQIISELRSALGYTPKFNSVFRTPEQQNRLIQQGYGVKNSYHLTGDAVDMTPEDWNNLPKEKQAYFRSMYDVINHNNHYHIEPR
jgi:hypothetical protein